jgi:hypothetical protein
VENRLANHSFIALSNTTPIFLARKSLFMFGFSLYLSVFVSMFSVNNVLQTITKYRKTCLNFFRIDIFSFFLGIICHAN